MTRAIIKRLEKVPEMLAVVSRLIEEQLKRKGWNGVSFNDCVEAVTPLHNDQTQILINFLTHAISIVADMEKAFHHINLHKADRDFLRWFWLEDPINPESPVAVYRFRVVPYGAKSSPAFILNALMMHHLKKSTSEIAADML
ncbi:uncharacterized protein LOC124199599 [Daphnia pulex]|uniref:uncharacterized protein LOC124199599 n=1 Tax=Daphnia pulex TaxID=6669 RepID=UPI001EE06395|nr:uncharacterized protein LOC124199599 [Daphnia pulex]